MPARIHWWTGQVLMFCVTGRGHRRKKRWQGRSLYDSGDSAAASIAVAAPPDVVNMEEVTNRRNELGIPTDVLVVILSRLSACTLCTYRCVCRSWNSLIFKEYQYRRDLPQFVSRFFMCNARGRPRLASISGECPSFSFLPRHMDLILIDSCNGLILFFCAIEHRHLVCNPVTETYILLPLLPPTIRCSSSASLVFDPIVSSLFHVVQLYYSVVCIYSSETSEWMCKQSEWVEGTVVLNPYKGEFVKGFMHMHAFPYHIVAVDMEGKTWRTDFLPGRGYPLSMTRDQGRLCVCVVDIVNMADLSIWMLEDIGTNRWTLNHRVNTLQLFGKVISPLGIVCANEEYRVITVYPEWNLIFLVGEHSRLMAYDMSRGKSMSYIPSSKYVIGKSVI